MSSRTPLVPVLLAVLLAGGPASADTGTALGDHPGEGSTAFTGLAQAPEANLFTGALSTGVPLEVPPGRNGMTPQLALQYVSGGGPSPFGHGWDLTLGRIERSTTRGVPRCTGPSTDDFVLVLPTGAAALVRETPSSRFYRPEVEQAWVRAERLEAENRWQVVDRSGRIYTFGDVDSARLANSDPALFGALGADGICRLTSVWALTRVADPNGNTIEIAWSRVFNTLIPATIRWGGNAAAGVPHFYTVRFLPEWRPAGDRIVSHRLGVAARLAWRIYAIDVESELPAAGTIVRTYLLHYRDGDGLGADGYQSMLAAVGVTGRPTQHFAYTASVTGHAAQTVSVARPTIAYPRLRQINASLEVSQSVLDMNGDGILDLVRSNDAPVASWAVFFGRVDAGSFGFDAAPTAWAAPGNWLHLRNVEVASGACSGNGWQCTRRDTFDLTGDGIPDFVDAASPNSWVVYPGRGVPQWGFGPGVAWPAPSAAHIRRSHQGHAYQDVVDLNGDGLLDLVKAGAPGQSPPHAWQVYLNTGSGFEPTPLPQFPAPVGMLVRRANGGLGHELIDFNGDGLPDVVRSGNALSSQLVDARCQPHAMAMTSCLEVYFNTGQGFTATPELIPVPMSNTVQAATAQHQVHQDLFDVNGDGLPDWIYRRYDFSVPGFVDEWRVLLNLGGTLEPLVYVPYTATPLYSEGIPARVWTQGAGWFRRAQDGETVVDVLDVNGDGLLDHVTSGGSSWHVRLHAATERPNLLGVMENGLGGTNTVVYRPSTAFDNTGGDGQPDLPFIQWVVARTRQNDGLCTPPAGADPFLPGSGPGANPCIDAGHEVVTHYQYEDGRFDPLAREFRGFRRVVRHASEGSAAPANVVATVFAQDAAIKGRPLAVDVYAGGGAHVRSEVTLWGTRSAGAGRTQLWLAEQRLTTYDTGAGVPRQLVTLSDPPDAYGNIERLRREGVFGSDWVETVTEWATPQSGSQVRDKPARVTVRDASGVLQEQWLYYDGNGTNGLSLGRVGAGNLKRVVDRQSATVANGPTRRMTYDALGNVVTATDARGAVTTTSYDSVRLYPTVITNPLGHSTHTEMDFRWGQPLRITDANGATTQFAYDAAGRRTCMARPGDELGQCSVATAYHFAAAPGALSWVERRERQDGRPPLWSRHYFDALGRARYTETLRVVEGASIVVRSNEVTYDAAGRVASLRLPYPRDGAPDGAITYDYRLNGGSARDPLGRIHRTVAADGTARATVYAGRLTQTWDEENVLTETVHDDHDREIERRTHGGAPMVLQQRYDGLGRLLEVAQNGVVLKQFVYDALGRTIEMHDSNSGTWRYGYDAAGNLVWQDDPNPGHHVQICYDALHRPTRRCAYAADFGALAACTAACPDAQAVVTQYDAPAVPFARGRPTRVDDGSGTSRVLAYDARGRTLETQRTVVVDGHVRTARLQFAYDANDRVVAVTYPDGEVVQTAYDDAGQPIALYNTAGTFHVTDARYDIRGRRTLLQHANGVRDERTFGTAATQHRLATLRSEGPHGRLLDLAYPEYSARGLLRRVADLRDPSGPLSNAATYGYDGLGRLRAVDSAHDPSDRTFDFDGMGNLTRNGDVVLTYGNPHRPHQATHVAAPSGSGPIGHDANGNRLGKPGQSYSYDPAGRMTRVDAGDRSVRFVYDGTGAVVAKVVEGLANGTTRFFDPRVEASDGWQTKWYFLGDQAVASVTNTYVAWQTAAAAGGGGIGLASASMTRPALVVTLAGEARWMVAAVLLTLTTALLFAPGRRAAVVGVRVRRGHALGVALLCAVGTLPWPLVVAPRADAGGSGGPTVLHYHLDHLGSTQALSEPGGTVVQQLRYHPFGGVRGRFSGNGSPNNGYWTSAPPEFTGFQSERYSGLTHAGARVYDPELGSFLSHDPRAQFPSPYSYGGGDPLNWTDPNGEFFFSFLIAVAVTAFASAAINTVIAAAQGLPLSAIGRAALGGAIAGAVGVGIGVLVSATSIGVASLAGTIGQNITLQEVGQVLAGVAWRSSLSTTLANAAGQTATALGAPPPVATLAAVLAGYAGTLVFDQYLAQGVGSSVTRDVSQQTGGLCSNTATHENITLMAAEDAGFSPAEAREILGGNLARDINPWDNADHFDALSHQTAAGARQQAIATAGESGYLQTAGTATHHIQDPYALGHIVPGTSALRGPVGAPLRFIIHQTAGGEITFRQASYNSTLEFLRAVRNAIPGTT